MRLSNYVGNTPLIPIEFAGLTVWGKCEFMNPGGSVKDRMATYILNDAERRGLIKKGDTLVEATSGNTGIAFAMLAAERGYKIYIVMPSNMSEERKQMLQDQRSELPKTQMPIPNVPMPDVTPVAATVDQNTGLTRTEKTLLSPDEQLIAQRNRGILRLV